ncbi:hypothetical protein GWI33_007958 [Rhynchophorus ferrugineus]|uniref:Calponin-homology (CH) domain-containing protein n=1 Tax=Rhynchophorus ferrugineus TaxID=354439 RepID=A0A834ICN0_RHYFE|nr:hypothetical protein GWI33_007958 [Rhynchophorus ferrugineus]
MFPGCIRAPRSVQGSTDDVSKQTKSIIQIYTDWANHYLEKARSKKRVNSLAIDCCDGVLLADVIESVTCQKIPDINRKPKTPSQMECELVDSKIRNHLLDRPDDSLFFLRKNVYEVGPKVHKSSRIKDLEIKGEKFVQVWLWCGRFVTRRPSQHKEGSLFARKRPDRFTPLNN